ncbi:hypothetical protein ACEWY4_001308 [Coilia grayii]|uniref:Gypsy retrotransposon integrase-like protein 1 n=1 Tax=Coilia grayii TaxID=363190 RepID=A0ABD1KSL3_9TELE
MKELARSFFWWPGVDLEIESVAKCCHTCQRVRNVPQLAPLHPWEFPEEPWQRVHVDFAGPVEGQMLLVAVDAHSKWPEVAVMKSTTAAKTIEKIGEMFSRFGCPMQLVSDNGPQLVRHDDQILLSAAPAPTQHPMVGSGDLLEDDSTDTMAAPGGVPVPEVAVPDPPPETQVGLPSPAVMSTSQKGVTPSPLRERRYPERERHPPKRMDL